MESLLSTEPTPSSSFTETSEIRKVKFTVRIGVEIIEFKVQLNSTVSIEQKRV